MSETSDSVIQNIIARTDIDTNKKLQLVAGAQVTQAIAKPLLSKMATILDGPQGHKELSLGYLRYKIYANTATTEDKQNYAAAKQQLNNTAIELAAAGQLDSNTKALIQQAMNNAKLGHLNESPSGTLTFSGFKDFLDYIFRTQALNPYSRERTCDIEFIDMLNTLSEDHDVTKLLLNELETSVKNVISLS